MGKRGGKKGNRGRGGFHGAGHQRPDNRIDKSLVVRKNDKFETYYNELNIIPDEEREAFWSAMRRDLPNSFRFTGSKAHALAVQERLRNFYIPEIKSITHEDQYVEAPQPVKWYPDQLAWYMTTPKHIIRRFKPFASFQKFLVAENDVGNISRQEVVSMIPPLVMDLKPGMTVLDLCAAPGSKSAQLLELLHAEEEERAHAVAESVENGISPPTGEGFDDDGRSTGLLIANDVDYKRAHMLVHQVKRLSSPNIIVTNHDATVFPSIKLPPVTMKDGKTVQNRYLKFDRILADVPCSGDGTPRKNLEIWRKWTPSNGLGLHSTQVRILVRALQMLKPGGRVVYSTCSMNPVEDEAVLSAAIEKCGGPDLVELVETKDLLPGLVRCPGLRDWTVMDKVGRTWKSYEDVTKHKSETGEEGMNRLTESMFPPRNDIPLERAMRVYPHQQDTGAFFIAILEKRSEFKVRPEGSTHAEQQSSVATPKVEMTNPSAPALSEAVLPSEEHVLKRKWEGVEAPSGHDLKRVKSTEDERTAIVNGKDETADTEMEAAPRPEKEPLTNEASGSAQVRGSKESKDAQAASRNEQNTKRKNRDQPFEEPFKYLDADIPELDQIWQFYQLPSRFPRDRFMVRNAAGIPTKNIYYTTALAKAILQENEGKGMKFVHSGVKMFVKQDAPAPDVCSWRIQTDGLRILETWVGKERIIRLQKRETLRKLLVEMFPKFTGEATTDLGEVGEQIRALGMGCCVLVVEPSEGDEGFSERMVFPLWKSIQSVNLMLPKEDRRAMLLRLFNDDTPLVNNSIKANQKKPTITDANMKDNIGDEEMNGLLRNSSSPEPLKDGPDEGEDGGIPLNEA